MDTSVNKKITVPVILKSDILRNFSKNFNDHLHIHYPDIHISATFVAEQFNRLAPYDERISRETARRWMKGDSIPEIMALCVLRLWLEVDLNALTEGLPPIKVDFDAHDPPQLNAEQFQALIVNHALELEVIKAALKKQLDHLAPLQKVILKK